MLVKLTLNLKTQKGLQLIIKEAKIDYLSSISQVTSQVYSYFILSKTQEFKAILKKKFGLRKTTKFFLNFKLIHYIIVVTSRTNLNMSRDI